MSPRERIAAIDVGSNTILLTVAEYDPEGGLVTIEEGEDQPRLAAGLSTSGRLTEDAMGRAVETLARMRETCRVHSVERVAAVATAAVREAANGPEFVGRVRSIGIPLRIISPEEEASLSYRSAVHHFPGNDPMLVADIGGGSLELTGAAGGRIQWPQSLPLGAVRLTELRLSLPQLREHIARTLEQAIPATEWLGRRVIGSGGTFATLAALALAGRSAANRHIHGTTVSGPKVRELLEALAALSPEERRLTAGLKPERADIIVAGLAVVAEVLHAAGADDVTVSGFGLRDGLLREMVELG